MDLEFLTKNQPELDQKTSVGRFTGKLAVVTGGASGIGFATVERFVNDGASVAIIDINESAGQAALNHITTTKNQKVLFYNNDVSKRDKCKDTALKISQDFDMPIHFLINSAADFNCKGLNGTEKHWNKCCMVNVAGSVFMVQAVLPYMAKDGSGSVVNFSSIAGIRSQPGRWTYAATKGALKTLTRNMALDLSDDKIRVNSVSPGWIWSPEMKKASSDGTKEAVHAENLQLVRRSGYTSEVAAAVTFLCSKDASFINGTDLLTDGGFSVMGADGFGNSAAFAGTKE